MEIKQYDKIEKVYKYPFMDLQINECFVAGVYTHELQRNMSNLGRYYAKKHNKLFKTREDNSGNLVVYRVS